ncbi:MAG: PLP-dependent aminotransferase family protein [Chloroflexi bacterium]|nr:PLP-dependent aminotransferase family protein [Chloroflexota bacterium]
MRTEWGVRLSAAAAELAGAKSSSSLRVTQIPDTISFAWGVPAAEAVPVNALREAFDRVLQHRGHEALGELPAEGYPPLRELIAERLAITAGIETTAENVVITSGSQQAIDLVAQLVLRPRSTVLVEQPTYFAAIRAFDVYQARYRLLPTDEHGPIVEALEARLSGGRPALLYVVPSFQNPTGHTVPLERRSKLAEIAAAHAVPILEDDAYGELRYEGATIPSITALASGRGSFYVGSFSKILAPGLRLAWVVAPPAFRDALVAVKRRVDRGSTGISQIAVWELARDGFLEHHVAFIRSMYRERRDTMLDALERTFPAGARWTRPEGGLFVWVELPEEVDTNELLARALDRGARFLPGQICHADGSGRNTRRLNFSNVSPERIEEGIRRLSEALGTE